MPVSSMFFFFNLPLYYLTCVCHYETSILTTISKEAYRRFLQLIHVKGAAVLDFNVAFPPTTIACPMIANFTTHLTVCHRRMLSFDPSWGMRTTTTHRWTCSGHLWVTSNTSEAIPARGDISLITSDWVLHVQWTFRGGRLHWGSCSCCMGHKMQLYRNKCLRRLETFTDWTFYTASVLCNCQEEVPLEARARVEMKTQAMFRW